jgi:hypothetical protein
MRMTLNRDESAPDTTWVKSSYSNGQGGECVEWAPEHAVATGEFLVRDSKDPSGPALTFSAGAWGAFVAGLKTGEIPTI